MIGGIRQRELAIARSPLGNAVQADELSQTLGLKNLGIVNLKTGCDFPALLFLDDQGLCLRLTGKQAPGPVRADFIMGKMGYRREHGGGAGQMVAKAVGLHKTKARLHVLDATAGLGQDAFILASLGCKVTLFERNPVVHALLADGLYRASLNVDCAPIIERMELRPDNSIEWLEGFGADIADIIYLDPMFPHREKSALVKKEMQVFQAIVGSDDDSEWLLQAALKCARYRVVVKRPRKASAITGPEPAARIEGKSSRYDIYAISALPAG